MMQHSAREPYDERMTDHHGVGTREERSLWSSGMGQERFRSIERAVVVLFKRWAKAGCPLLVVTWVRKALGVVMGPLSQQGPAVCPVEKFSSRRAKKALETCHGLAVVSGRFIVVRPRVGRADGR